MSKMTLALAATLSLALSGAALAQAPTTGGSNQGNVNKSGAVGGTSQGAVGGASAGAMERTGSTGPGMAPGTSGGPRVSTPGAPAGSSMGNGTTGSGAAPSGR